MLDTVLPIKRPLGRPRKRPAKLHTDKGYDAAHCRAACRQRGITPRIARRGIESRERLGRHRWVVERTFAWLSRFRRLRVRDERLAPGAQTMLPHVANVSDLPYRKAVQILHATMIVQQVGTLLPSHGRSSVLRYAN